MAIARFKAALWATVLLAASVGVTLASAQKKASDEQGTAVWALEMESWKAWKAQDAEFFRGFFSEDHLDVHGTGRSDKSGVVNFIAARSCVVNSYSISDEKVIKLTDDAYAVSYRAEQDTKCGGSMVPSPAWVSSVYVRRGGRWVNVLYQQSIIRK